MLKVAVRPCPLRILAAPGQWPRLPKKAALALQSASWVAWQPGADPSLLAWLGPTQRHCELSHALEVPSALQGSGIDARDLVLLQGPDTSAPDWGQSLGSSYSRFETIALQPSKTDPTPPEVILTRTHPHNLGVGTALLDAGIGSLSLPTLAFGPPPDPTLLATTLRDLDGFFGIIVSSPRGAKILATAAPLPDFIKVVAVGSATRATLLQYQLPCHLEPKLAHSEGLADALHAQGWLGQHWLHLRGTIGREVLKNAIESAQGQYTLLAGYQSFAPALAPALLRASQAASLKVISFASGQSYLNYKQVLLKISPPKKVAQHLASLRILSFGPITSQTIRQDGQDVAFELARPSAELAPAAILDLLAG